MDVVLSALEPLLPPEMSASVALGLVGLSFLTATFTAAVGLGGGIVMIAVLASILPPAVAIPVHGAVQLGANCGRVAIMRRNVDWGLVGLFTAGGLVGVTIAASLFVALSRSTLQAVLGVFVLYSVWSPRLRPANVPRWSYPLVGAAASFVTMFVGGTGPFVAAFLSPERLGRHGLVATQAACTALQHGLKVVAFGAIGFLYLPWFPLLAVMIAVGLVGTFVGRNLLNRLSDRVFLHVFRAVLTVLGLRLLWAAFLDG